MEEILKKDINNCTKKEFESLPKREWGEDIGEFDSLIILPTRHTHDSGYRCMDFVAVKREKAICRLSGCSDVIHIDGIGGFGEWEGDIPTLIPPKEWCVDCLKKSGLLRIFSGYKLKCGAALSSFELFATRKI
jgi:hypothetical protein